MTGALGRVWQGARRPAASSIEGGGGQRLAADALLATAEAIARALKAHELAADEPVLCVSANAPHDLAGLLGIWLAGGVAVPVHARAASATLMAIRGASGSRLSVAGGEVERLLRQPPAPRQLLRGAALIVFTSGSTGTPKGVVLGHQQLAGKLEVLAGLIQLCPADTVILPLQLTFIFGIWVSLLTISSGARLVLLGKFTASELAGKLRDGASVVAVVPSMLRGLLASEPPPFAPRLKSLLCGGEILALAEGSRH